MASAPLGTLLRSLLRGSAPELPDQQLLQQFATQGDQAAFADLLERHGPLVLRVSRRLSLDDHDAEDAFQVTFLELASRAGSIRRGEALAGWLFRVAHRVASHARTAAVRRKMEERKKVSEDNTSSELDRRECDAVLHEEVNRLPRKYRDAVVLCYWNGKSNEEAAAELGWPVGTVKIRLTRARELLRGRLSRRGVGVGAAALALLGAEAAHAALPGALRVRTLESVSLQLAGKLLAGEALPASAARLLHDLARSAVRARLRVGAALVFAMGVIGSAAAVGVQALRDGPVAEAEIPAPALLERQPRATVPFVPRLVPPDQPKPLQISALGEELPAGASARIGTLRLRHEDFVYALGYSADGKHLFSSTPRGLRVWEAATGKPIREFQAPGMALQGLTDKGAVRVVNYQAGTETHMPVDWAKELGEDAFRWAETRSIQGTVQGDRIRIVASGTGKELGSVPNPKSGLYGVPVISVDGTLVAGAANPAYPATGGVHLWDLATGKELLRLKDRATSVAIAPDGKTLAVGSYCTVRLYDVKTGQELPVSAEATSGGAAVGMAFHKKTQHIACVDEQGVVRIHDPATGRLLRQFDTEGNGALIAHAFSADGAMLATRRGGPVLVWDVLTGKQLAEIEVSTCFTFSPNNKHLVTVGPAREVRFWNLASRQKERVLVCPSPPPVLLEPAPAGDAEMRRGIELMVRIEREFAQAIHRLAFSPDGQMLAAGMSQQTVLWDIATGICYRDLPWEVGAHLGFGPDSRSLIQGLLDGSVALCEVATGKLRAAGRFSGEGLSTSALTPDGRTLAVATPSTIRLLDVVTDQLLASWGGHRAVQALAFSADGKWLASSSKDTTVLIWDVSKLAAREALPPIAGPEDLHELWNDLAATDARRAYQAVLALANVPEQSVPFLSKQLRPATDAESQRLSELIQQLGSAQFPVRQEALANLEKAGFAAQRALRTALDEKPPLETRQRLERLLERVMREQPAGDHLRMIRAVEILERVGSPAADKVLQELANGGSNCERTHQAHTALQRREASRRHQE